MIVAAAVMTPPGGRLAGDHRVPVVPAGAPTPRAMPASPGTPGSPLTGRNSTASREAPARNASIGPDRPRPERPFRAPAPLERTRRRRRPKLARRGQQVSSPAAVSGTSRLRNAISSRMNPSPTMTAMKQRQLAREPPRRSPLKIAVSCRRRTPAWVVPASAGGTTSARSRLIRLVVSSACGDEFGARRPRNTTFWPGWAGTANAVFTPGVCANRLGQREERLLVGRRRDPWPTSCSDPFEARTENRRPSRSYALRVVLGLRVVALVAGAQPHREERDGEAPANWRPARPVASIFRVPGPTKFDQRAQKAGWRNSSCGPSVPRSRRRSFAGQRPSSRRC